MHNLNSLACPVYNTPAKHGTLQTRSSKKTTLAHGVNVFVLHTCVGMPELREVDA